MNNTTFYKVLGNINHNGTGYEKGTFVDGLDFGGALYGLVEAGALKPIEGASTAEEAAQLDAEETANVEAATTEVASQDTWGARPDEEEKEPGLTPDAEEQKPEDEGGEEAPEGSGNAPAEEVSTEDVTPESAPENADAKPEEKKGFFGGMFGGNKDAADNADNL